MKIGKSVENMGKKVAGATRRMVYRLKSIVSHTRTHFAAKALDRLVEEMLIDAELEAVADVSIRELERAMLVVDWRYDSVIVWPPEVQATLDSIDTLERGGV